jgi:hypothetical protein
MKGLERTADGRCRIGSQFMIWVGDLEYKVNPSIGLSKTKTIILCLTLL